MLNGLFEYFFEYFSQNDEYFAKPYILPPQQGSAKGAELNGPAAFWHSPIMEDPPSASQQAAFSDLEQEVRTMLQLHLSRR